MTSSVAAGSAARPEPGAEPPLRRNRDFLLLWVGAGFAVLGARITAIAYPLLILWQTGSITGAGLVSTAALLPMLLVQLPAGLLVDRWDRRRLMIAADAGCVLVTATVAVAVWADLVWVWHLVVVAFVQSSLAIVHQLAERSAVRNLVTPGQLPAALSQNEARQRGAMLLGRPAGGALFELVRWAPFLATTLAHLVSLVSLLLIRRPFQSTAPAGVPGTARTLRADLVEGIGWVWRRRFLRTVMIFIAISNIPFEGLALAVMYVVKQDGGSGAVVGLLAGVSGVGGLLGALGGTWWLRRLDLRAVVIGGLAGWALVMPAMAFTRDVWALGVLFAAMSYIGGVFNVAGGIYLVRITPDALMGRVGAVATLLGSGTNFLGPLLAGYLLAALPVATAVLALSGVMVVLVAVAVLSPAVRAVVDTPEGRRLS
ncbi:MFS transporter [Plantactinospora sp. B5E13]|uniref:MFS transporter n=1 Tax=Plantactinospora sp. B5E13 TaxID=3153758 RepID=UPI00325C8062